MSTATVVMGYAGIILLSGQMALHGGGVVLVEGGESRSRIVVAADAPRLVGLAALELRDYIERLSGVEMEVGSESGGDGVISIFVGRSGYTDELGVTDDGLEHGAFRIVAGPGHVVLLGFDRDYEPLAMTDEQWQALTGAEWWNPVREEGQFNAELGIWSFDEGGSLYAVYELLRRLGVRWFMPGELGEVIPEMATIEIAATDEVVRPDYAVRHWIWAGRRFSTAGVSDVLFDRRVGAGARYEALGNTQLTHGIRNVHASPALQREHPEYYALIGSERDIHSGRTGHACFSSLGLEREVTAYARAVFDHAGVQLLQLSPQDGFRQCECEDCSGMSPSQNVFGFLNRVASNLYESYPDRIILAAGYGSYRQPPEGMGDFSPNLAVTINNMGRPRFGDASYWAAYQDLVERWQGQVGASRILRVENTLYGADPLPIVHPRAIARDLRSMKGISLGERNELRVNRDLPASTHLNRYVMGRYYWDAEQDIEELLTDYYQKFYGPAADGMRVAFDFAEAHPFGRSPESGPAGWYEAQVDIHTSQLEFWTLVEAARESAGDSVYGERIDLLLSEAPASTAVIRGRLEKLLAEGDPRAAALVAVAVDTAGGGEPVRYRMVDRVTGEDPPIETTFTLAWDGDFLVVDILCQEPDMETLQSSAAIVLGDNVAIMIETPFHAHYHVEVNPDGEVYDRIWGAAQGDNWSSQAIVKTEAGEDYWRAIVRIPVMNTEEGQGDPLHFVVGERPTAQQPWYFNIGRARVRGEAKETFLFSPVYRGNFHQPARFARLVVE